MCGYGHMNLFVCKWWREKKNPSSRIRTSDMLISIRHVLHEFVCVQVVEKKKKKILRAGFEPATC